MDWLNACHIDTPVVSPMGPQRHNGIGEARPYATRLLSVPICPRLLVLLLVDIAMLMILCDPIKRNQKTESLGVAEVHSCSKAQLQHYSSTLNVFVCFFPPWMGELSCDSRFALIIAPPVQPVMISNGEYYLAYLLL